MSSLPRLQRDEYVVFCEGVQQITGIDLQQYKRGQMERRVRTFAERRGAATLADYLSALRRDRGQVDDFLDRVTINVSQLWRNPDQWARLASTVLPELAQKGRIRAWSAGCSYGAESYTLAALCLESVPGARVDVFGSDIDARMVRRAREGFFSIEDARDVPAASLARWFDREPEGYRAKAALRRLVRFDTGDLLRDRFQPAAYDLVMCRNVVIYFTDPVRNELHARLAAALRPGGYLMIGSSERVASPRDAGLVPVHPFVYQRTS
jgi:chemotaxis protein methyltransferase CheR